MDYERLEEDMDPGHAMPQSKGQPVDQPMAPPYEQSVGPMAPPYEQSVGPPAAMGPPPPMGMGPPPVMQQPPQLGPPIPVGPPPVSVVPVQSTVVINQVQAYGQAYPQNIREWSTDLCSCCDNMGVCMFGFCCPWCQAASVASRMNENGCCVVCCVPGGTIAMRTKYRTLYGIKGDICNDCCVMFWCHQCAVCQMAREQTNAPY